MATLTIVTKGIALISMNKEWNVYFPFDKEGTTEGCHDVSFQTSKNPVPIKLNKPGQSINVYVENSLNSPHPVPIPMPDPYSFLYFVDLTHPSMHDNDLELRRNWHEGTVLMTVQGGVYSASLSVDTFTLFDAGDKPVRNLGVIGVEGTIRLQGDKIIVNVTGERAIEFVDNGAILIDNDCKLDKNNDLPMIYKNVIDVEQKFKVKSDMNRNLPCNSFRVSRPLN